MIIAVQKYNKKPAFTSLGTKRLQDLDKPILVAVCKLSQFDYANALSIGYKRQTDFFSGQLNTGTDYLYFFHEHANCGAFLYP